MAGCSEGGTAESGRALALNCSTPAHPTRVTSATFPLSLPVAPRELFRKFYRTSIFKMSFFIMIKLTGLIFKAYFLSYCVLLRSKFLLVF